MRNFSFLLMLALTPVLLMSQNQVINDPNVQVRTVSSFRSIRIEDGIDLYLNQSGTEAVAVSAASDEIRDKIRTEVQDGELKIYFAEHGKWWKHMNNRKMKAYVSCKTLKKLEAAGASDVYLNGMLNVDELSINMSGASDLKGKNGEIRAMKMDLVLSGASDAIMKGAVSSLKVRASGASDLKGYELTTDNCDADASGASDIMITVNKALTAKASGASGVHFKGDGVINDLKTSGASRVSRKD
jgi:hypothetical protein